MRRNLQHLIKEINNSEVTNEYRFEAGCESYFSGGTGHGITTRLTLPTAWVNALGATATDRGVEITLDPDNYQIVVQFKKPEADNQEQIERMAKYLEKIKENA